MNALDYLETLESVGAVRDQLFEAKRIKLHTGMEGFDSPDAYGIYKSTGGEALGVVGSRYEPVDLHLLYDSILQNATCCNTLRIEDMMFRELFGGRKVEFVIPAQRFEVDSPMVGDVIESRLIIRTGFDGLTKTTMNFETYRIWCSNGCASWMKDESVALKNTRGNNLKGKVYHMADKMIKIIDNIDTYKEKLNEAVNTPITQKQIDEFLLSIIGKTGEDLEELSTKSRNMIDAINESVAIEAQNTGWNAYSLLQGVTRYTSHDVLEGDLSTVAFNKAGRMNKKAQEFVFAMS